MDTHLRVLRAIQHDRVQMVFKIFSVLLIWTKVALALEGLTQYFFYHALRIPLELENRARQQRCQNSPVSMRVGSLTLRCLEETATGEVLYGCAVSVLSNLPSNIAVLIWAYQPIIISNYWYFCIRNNDNINDMSVDDDNELMMTITMIMIIKNKVTI